MTNYISNDGESWGYKEEMEARNDYLASQDEEHYVLFNEEQEDFEKPQAVERNGERVVRTRIAFDVDGTLIKRTADGDVPRYDIIAILKTFVAHGHRVFVWSGGGEDYAEMWARKLGLLPDVRIIGKSASYGIQLAFDDEDLTIADVTIRV